MKKAKITVIGRVEIQNGHKVASYWSMQGGDFPGLTICGLEQKFGGWSVDELEQIANFAAMSGATRFD